MAGHSKHVVFNTRERLLSTDFGLMQSLIDAGIADTVVAQAAKGNALAAGGQGVSGVVDGFVVSPDAPGVTSVMRVGPGLAYKVVTPADPTTDSRYQRLEQRDTRTVDLQPFRAASPRWVAIWVKPNITSVLTTARDVWQPGTGTFSTVNLPKIVDSLPDIGVTAGTPAASPVLPDGEPGSIPLAYVYLAALPAVSVATTDLVLCRPLYSSIHAQAVGRSEGGGVQVSAFGDTVMRMKRTQGQWGPAGAYTVSGSLTVDLLGLAWESGQSYATLTGGAINQCVSFYAAAPPWPLGHDADISGLMREFQNFTTRFAGSGIGLTSGCVVVATNNGPTTPSHLGGTGNITLTDPIWGSGGTATTSHYIGAATYIHSPQGILPQTVQGSDVMYVTPMNTPTKIPLATSVVNMNANQEFFDPDDFSSNGGCYPPFTSWVDVGFYFQVTAGAQGQMALSDDTDPTHTLEPHQWATNTQHDWRGRVRLYVGATGQAVLNAAESAGQNVTYSVYGCGYRDPFLSQR